MKKELIEDKKIVIFCYDMKYVNQRIGMYQVNILDEVRFDDEGVLITEVMVTPYSKEYLITMQRHQVMIDHESSDPVTFHIMEGDLRIRIEEDERIVRKGDVLTLERGVVHHLEALEESLLRLTIHLC